MPDEPPSILPRGTGTRRPLSPSPALPGSAVNIQSVAGLSCIAAGAIGRADISGGRSPASINATRQFGSSDRRDAITAPAEPPPTTLKSNLSPMYSPPRAGSVADGPSDFTGAINRAQRGTCNHEGSQGGSNHLDLRLTSIQ